MAPESQNALPNLHPMLRRLAPRFPLVIAHRGGNHAPENTITAFEKALEQGADVLEMDIHLTKDGELIVSHDRTGKRCTNTDRPEAKWNEYTLQEVKDLDAGWSHTKDGATFPFRSTGIQIPTFREVLERFPTCHLNVDIKHHEEAAVTRYLEVVDELAAAARIITCSFNEATLDSFRRQRPDMPTGASMKEVSNFYLYNAVGALGWRTPKSNVLEMPSSQLVGRFLGRVGGYVSKLGEKEIRVSHAAGQNVFVWTVNDAKEMEALLEIGVDGIITDDVPLAHRVIAARRKRRAQELSGAVELAATATTAPALVGVTAEVSMPVS